MTDTVPTEGTPARATSSAPAAAARPGNSSLVDDPFARAPDWVRALLSPRAVALVGASGDATKNTARPQRYLQSCGWQGRIVPINPGRSEILGLRAYPSLLDAPGDVDQAFVMVGAEDVATVIEHCAQRGVRVATIFSDGFAEVGGRGAELQARLVERARTLGVRLLGPNCMGLIRSDNGLALTVNAVLDTDAPRPGSLGLISQSGSMLGAIMSRGLARGLGFSTMISVGNEADIGVAELIEVLADDPRTDTILLFLETLRDAPAFARAVARARLAGKPVVAYLLGQSAIGEKLAQSHTGAIAGSGRALRAFLAHCGVIRVTNLEALLEGGPLFRCAPRASAADPADAPAVEGSPAMPTTSRSGPAERNGAPGRLPTTSATHAPSAPHAPPTPRSPRAPPRVAVLTTTGGGAAMVVDQLGLRGIETARPDEALRTLLAGQLELRDAPIIDLTLTATSDRYRAVLEALARWPGCDAVLAVVGSSARSKPELAVRPIVDAARGWAQAGGPPLAVFLAPQAEESLARLSAAGIAAFRTPEACADALAATLSAGLLRARMTDVAPAATPQARWSDALLALLRDAGPAPDEAQCYPLLQALGIPVAPWRVNPLDAPSDGLDASAAALPGPWVLKACSVDLPHKSDSGAVALGLRDAQAVLASATRMRARLAHEAPDARLRGWLVQQQVHGIGEVLLGLRRDPVVGTDRGAGRGRGRSRVARRRRGGAGADRRPRRAFDDRRTAAAATNRWLSRSRRGRSPGARARDRRVFPARARPHRPIGRGGDQSADRARRRRRRRRG